MKLKATPSLIKYICVSALISLVIAVSSYFLIKNRQPTWTAFVQVSGDDSLAESVRNILRIKRAYMKFCSLSTELGTYIKEHNISYEELRRATFIKDRYQVLSIVFSHKDKELVRLFAENVTANLNQFVHLNRLSDSFDYVRQQPMRAVPTSGYALEDDDQDSNPMCSKYSSTFLASLKNALDAEPDPQVLKEIDHMLKDRKYVDLYFEHLTAIRRFVVVLDDQSKAFEIEQVPTKAKEYALLLFVVLFAFMLLTTNWVSTRK